MTARAPRVLGALIGAAILATQAQPGEGQTVSDLKLEIELSASEVLSGEEFQLDATLTNTGGASVLAVDDVDDDKFVVVLTPKNGGDEIRLSEDALNNALYPDDLLEDIPPPGVPLGAGETREFDVRPVSLSPAPLPPGDYLVTLEVPEVPDDGGRVKEHVISTPAPLRISRPDVTRYTLSAHGGMADPHLAIIHRGGEGGRVYAGETRIDAPLAGGLLALSETDIGAQLALARRTPHRPGPAWAAWIDDAGQFHAALPYTTFIAGQTAPTPTGLTAARLHRPGWQDEESDAQATFMALGMADQAVTLALIRVDADKDWSAVVTVSALPLPSLPAEWAAAPRASGGYALIAGGFRDAPGRALALSIGEDGAVQGEPVVLNDGPAPVQAVSLQFMAEDAARVDILTGPDPEGPTRMNLRRTTTHGDAPLDAPFGVPSEGGKTPTGWIMMEGAPRTAELAAQLNDKILGLKFVDGATGGVLARGVGEIFGLQVKRLDDTSYVLWREPTGELRQVHFPD